MKLLVFGHSDSDGSQISRGQEAAWPWLVAEALKVAGHEAEVVHRILYPGPSARAYAEKQLAQHEPDIVVVAATTHSVVVQLVSNRVRQRFGERAARLAERAERSAARTANRLSPGGSRATMTLRRTARRLLGTSPALTPDELVASYEAVMSAVAQREHVHCIIGGGIGYIGELRALNPGLDELQRHFQARFRQAAEHHHFDWLSHEAVLGGPGVKDQYYHPDGMHTDERSHRLFADALMPLILRRL